MNRDLLDAVEQLDLQVKAVKRDIAVPQDELDRLDPLEQEVCLDPRVTLPV